MDWMLLVCVLAAGLSLCHASHFRGAIIMWKPAENGNDLEIEVSYRISWRRDYDSNEMCDQRAMSSQTILGRSLGNLECFLNCYETLGDMGYICTDINMLENWSSGRRKYRITFRDRLGNRYFEFGFKGNAWISGLNYVNGGNWMLRVSANLTRRSDTGNINSSPITDMPPIVRKQYGCNHTIAIPVSDPDSDFVRCRWADYRKQECASICSGFPEGWITYDTCVISFRPSRIGWFALAVQIEDFATYNSTTPLSSIPLQFLLEVYASTDSCGAAPEFIPPTLPDGSCIAVPFNTTFTTKIVARTVNNTRSIADIKTVSPTGTNKSAVGIYIEEARAWYVNITWTPQPDQTGVNNLCFTPVDDGGASGDKRCIVLLGGVEPPQLINGTQNPMYEALPSNYRWSVMFDQVNESSDRPAYIYLFYNNGTEIERIDVRNNNRVTFYTGKENRRMSFTTSAHFIEKEYYYFLFDADIVKGNTSCGAESAAVNGPNFWKFRIRDVTPPIITFLNSTTIGSTGPNPVFAWSFNEVSTASCLLRHPNFSKEPVECNNSWSGYNLTEGDYILTVTYKDLDENYGRVERLRWYVDRTPPLVVMENSCPSSISGDETPGFRLSCTDFHSRCQTVVCKVYSDNDQVKPWENCRPPSYYWWRYEDYQASKLLTENKYTFMAHASDAFGNNKTYHLCSWTTDFNAPVFTGCNDSTVTCGSNYKMIPRPSVQDNYDQKPSLMSRNYNDGRCKIRRVWTATDQVGNYRTCSQNISFETSTPEKTVVIGHPLPAAIACGQLDNMTAFFKLQFKVKNPCTLPLDIQNQDNTTANGKKCDVLIQRNWTVSDCRQAVSIIQMIRVLPVQKPVSPTVGQTGVPLQFTLRWPDFGSSSPYYVYIWPHNSPRPEESTGRTLNTYYSPQTALKPAMKYLWQVSYSYENQTIFSPIWGFETRKYPDLTVTHITVPGVAWSGKTVQVRWYVMNNGTLGTQSHYWYDYVYLSSSDTFNSRNIRRVASVRQWNIIMPKDGYSSTATIQLQKSDMGTLYIFVETNAGYYGVSELRTDNNIMRSQSGIDVKLTPPPDLDVMNVHTDTSTYSASRIQVWWTVKNIGKGDTLDDESRWYDRITWSAGRLRSSTLGTYVHYGGLQSGRNYTKSVWIRVPKFIHGQYSVLVETDVYNYVFENRVKENNKNYSNTISVKLTPPPDLAVSRIKTSPHFTTGDRMGIEWTVVNQGFRAPYQNYWIDRLTIHSEDHTWTDLLDTQSFYGNLNPTENYSRYISYSVPPSWRTGRYYLSVHTDYYGNVFELEKTKGNNIKSYNINITWSLPDLELMDFSLNVSSNSTTNVIHVTWSVVNKGPGRTLVNTWLDSIKWRNAGDAYYQVLEEEQIYVENKFPPNTVISKSKSILIPQWIKGNVEFVVVADNYHRSGDSDTTNNYQPPVKQPIKLLAPDLNLVLLPKGPLEVIAGSNVELSLNITNIGVDIREDVTNIGVDIQDYSYWMNRVYLSQYSYRTYVWIYQSLIQEGPLKHGGFFIQNVSVHIPENIAGTYYIHVELDYRKLVYEGDRVANNFRVVELSVQSQPSPDLIVTNIETELVNRGELSTRDDHKFVRVTWSVLNNGNSMRGRSHWQDSIALSQNSLDVTNLQDLTVIGRFPVSGLIRTNEAYTMTKTVLIPSTIKGDVYVYVMTDSNFDLREHNGERNNINRGIIPLKIRPKPMHIFHSYLRNVMPADSDNAFRPGSFVNVTFEVKNIGGTTSKSSWIDVIYLYSEYNANQMTVTCKGSELLKSTHIGQLLSEQSYKVEVQVQIPYGYRGNIYFYIYPDSFNADERDILSGDSSELGPSPASTQSSLVKTEFNFTGMDNYTTTLAPLKLPNLLPLLSDDSVSITKHIGGQPFTFYFNITNNGSAAVTRSWYTGLYLSEDFYLDPFDVTLGSSFIAEELAVNATMEGNITVFLPYDLKSLTYYLVLQLDVRNEIYEDGSGEQDNELKLPFAIVSTLSTDIAVVDVNATNNVSYGRTMEVRWGLINNGSQTAEGYKCDSVYLSEDEKWDMYDEQVGRPHCDYVLIKPYNDTVSQENVYTLEANAPLVSTNSYHTIVKSRSNIVDNNLENNVGVAPSKTNATLSDLPLDHTKSQSWSASPLAFRIPSVPSGQTMVVKIYTSNTDVTSRVLVKYSRPATQYDFDTSSNYASRGQAIVTVPDTHAGDYYILIYSAEFFIRATNMTVMAKLAKFEIFDVVPKRAAPLGNVTIRIEGSLFPATVTAHLINDNINICASKVYYFSSELAYATFDVFNISLGNSFHLLLLNPENDKNATIEKALEIVDGSVGHATVKLSRPQRLRSGEEGLVTVHVVNVGDTDILTPILSLKATGNGHLKLVSETDTTKFKKINTFIACPNEGLGGIIAPKGYSRLVFIAKQEDSTIGRSSLRLQVSMIKPNKDTPHTFVDEMEAYRPSHYDQSSWRPVWLNFMTTIGNSTKSLASKVSEVANQFSLAGRKVYNFEDIVFFLLDMADTPIRHNILVYTIDVVSRDRGEAVLDLQLERYLSPRVGSRSVAGAMGKGWILPLWDTYIKSVNTESIIMTLEKVDYSFVRVGYGVFENPARGTLLQTSNGYTYANEEERKELVFSLDTLKLVSVVSTVDWSHINLTYDSNGNITSLNHSSGPYLTINYDTSFRIVSTQLRNDSFDESLTSMYRYDPSRNLLRLVRTGHAMTRYLYFYNDTIKAVINPDRTQILLHYDHRGFLARRRFITRNVEVSALHYHYDGAAQVTTTSSPDEASLVTTIDEKGHTAAMDRKGYLRERTVNTFSSKTIYQGQLMIAKERYGTSTKSVLIEDGNGDSIEIFFDNFGRLKVLQDGDGNMYQVLRFDNGTTNKIIYPDGTEKKFNYTRSGYEVLTQSEIKQKYEFNEKKQLILKDSGNDDVTTYQYDTKGNLAKALNKLGTVSLEYAENLVSNITYKGREKGTKWVSFKYNERNIKTEIQSQDYHASYKYTNEDKIVKVLSGHKELVRLEYDEKGRLKRKVMGNHAFSEYGYDKNTGLLKSLHNYAPNNTTVSSFIYEYDPRHRRISLKTDSGTWKFRYDISGQLIYFERNGDHVTEYTYDNRKNRKFAKENGIEKKYTANKMNQYEAIDGRTFDYDKNGNLLEKNDTKSIKYWFDANNRLAKFWTDTKNCSLMYNSLGNLQSKKCDNEVATYLLDPFGKFGQDVLIQETTKGSVSNKTKFYYGGDSLGLIAMERDGNFYYFQFDLVGSVVGILDENGRLLSSYQYDPFGQIIESNTSLENVPFTFVGQWGILHMAEVEELFFMRARFYDAELGRYLSMNRFGIDGRSKNFYAYVYNNPVSFTDPEGEILENTAIAGTTGGGHRVLPYHSESGQTGTFTLGGAAGVSLEGAVDGATLPLKPDSPNVAKAVSFVGKVVKDIFAKVLRENNVENAVTDALHRFTDEVAGTLSEPLMNTLETVIDKKLSNPSYPWKDAVHGLEEGAKKWLSNPDVQKMLAKKGIHWLLMRNKYLKVMYRIYKVACYALESGAIGQEKAKLYNNTCTAFDKIESMAADILIDDILPWVLSHDPNDILGPAGYGAAKFVARDKPLDFTIRFENDENATAPAQRVFITHKFDDDLDPQTFQLGSFGFGNFTREIKVVKSVIQENLNFTEELGLFVRVVGGLDLIEGEATWEFQSLDPVTGLAPTDPGLGFLPPNNDSISGQGFVKFSIQPKPSAENLARIETEASIYFDKNEPIDTPKLVHTIDGSIPRINVSVVNETLSSGVLTLALDSEDEGAGVKEVNIFLKEESGYSLLVAGVNDTSTTLPLAPGYNYTILPIAVDHVGNRIQVDQVDVEELVVVEFVIPDVIPCNCSGHGNCSMYGICSCEEGFYGTYCNITKAPLEPPILELKPGQGFENKPISIYVMAKNQSEVDDMVITISGFPPGTQFSAGVLTTQDLTLNWTDFGTFNLTTPVDTAGNVSLKVIVHASSGNSSLTRSGELNVEVLPNIDGVGITLEGCFDIVDNTTKVELNVSLLALDPDASEIVESLQLTVPEWIEVDGAAFEGNGKYELKDVSLNDSMYLTVKDRGIFQPVNLTITVTLQEKIVPSVKGQSSQEFQISEICMPDCQVGKYGSRCEEECPCNATHITGCGRFYGQCVCTGHWEGDNCDTDVNECTINSSLCDQYENRTCHNIPGNYTCVCDHGYEVKNDTCVECEDYFYGFNCNQNCACNKTNTVSCDKVTGRCACNDMWKGTMCTNDVNECERDPDICAEYNNTGCQNRLFGYDCLCLLGYEKNETSGECERFEKLTTTYTPPVDDKVTRLEISLDIQLPPGDNLNVSNTNRVYKERAAISLTEYYRGIMGINFVKVIVLSVRLGSLVVEHDVVMRNTSNADSQLVAAAVELASGNTTVDFDGKEVAVKDVKLENKPVPRLKNESQRNEFLCKKKEELYPCAENEHCEVHGGQAECRNRPSITKISNANGGESGSNVDLPFVIGLSSGIPSALLLISVIILVVVVCKRRNSKELDDSDENIPMGNMGKFGESGGEQRRRGVENQSYTSDFYEQDRTYRQDWRDQQRGSGASATGWQGKVFHDHPDNMTSVRTDGNNDPRYVDLPKEYHRHEEPARDPRYGVPNAGTRYEPPTGDPRYVVPKPRYGEPTGDPQSEELGAADIYNLSQNQRAQLREERQRSIHRRQIQEQMRDRIVPLETADNGISDRRSFQRGGSYQEEAISSQESSFHGEQNQQEPSFYERRDLDGLENIRRPTVKQEGYQYYK